MKLLKLKIESVKIKKKSKKLNLKINSTKSSLLKVKNNNVFNPYYVSFLKYYGINCFKATYICYLFGLSKNIYTCFVPDFLKFLIKVFIFKCFFLNKELEVKEKKNFDFFVLKNNYRVYRHFSRLPVRGQRTVTNAKTQKKLVCRLRRISKVKNLNEV